MQNTIRVGKRDGRWGKKLKMMVQVKNNKKGERKKETIALRTGETHQFCLATHVHNI